MFQGYRGLRVHISQCTFMKEVSWNRLESRSRSGSGSESGSGGRAGGAGSAGGAGGAGLLPPNTAMGIAMMAKALPCKVHRIGLLGRVHTGQGIVMPC